MAKNLYTRLIYSDRDLSLATTVIRFPSVACISGNDSSLTEVRERSNVSNELLCSGLNNGFVSPLLSSASDKTVVKIPGTREEEICGKKSV